MEDIYPIGEQLSKQLNKAGVARIKASQMHDQLDTVNTPKSSNRELRVANTVLSQIQGKRVATPGCPVDDLITGTSRLDWYDREDRNIPLSVNLLYVSLQSMEVINVRNISLITGLKPRQARRYVKACQILIPFLETALKDSSVEAPDDWGA